jgi:hypothetical protein
MMHNITCVALSQPHMVQVGACSNHVTACSGPQGLCLAMLPCTGLLLCVTPPRPPAPGCAHRGTATG